MPNRYADRLQRFLDSKNYDMGVFCAQLACLNCRVQPSPWQPIYARAVVAHLSEDELRDYAYALLEAGKNHDLATLAGVLRVLRYRFQIGAPIEHAPSCTPDGCFCATWHCSIIEMNPGDDCPC